MNFLTVLTWEELQFMILFLYHFEYLNFYDINYFKNSLIKYVKLFYGVIFKGHVLILFYSLLFFFYWVSICFKESIEEITLGLQFNKWLLFHSLLPKIPILLFFSLLLILLPRIPSPFFNFFFSIELII